MRLRQVALIAHRIEPVAAALEEVFGLRIAHRDPAVGVFGLANVVMPVGGDFLEVLEPLREDTAGARYLARRGGDCGYMVILQDEDALAHRGRIAAAGVRIIAAGEPGRYRFTHFHPADCAGVLLSIDSVVGEDWRESLSDWPPAGPCWREFPSAEGLGIPSVTLQSQDPAGAADRWARLLGRPHEREADGFAIRLDAGVIRFVGAVDVDGTGVVALDIKVTNPAAALARARAMSLTIEGGAVLMCGVAIRPVA